MNVIGDVVGKTCLIVDDMIDTGGTLSRGAGALKDKGAEKIYACCTHGVFAGDAIKVICQAPFEQVVTTNSIPLSPEGEQCAKIKVLHVGKLLAEAIHSIHRETSVSKLFI
jgi:ribose-phosphate pyrophosphokinase